MTSTLARRLDSSKKSLEQASSALALNLGILPPEVESQVREFADCRSEVEHWKSLLDARAHAMEFLVDLESKSDAQDLVPFGDTHVKFAVARMLGTQAYISTKWALADRVAAMAGSILCPPATGSDPMSPPQLVQHFVQKKKSNSSVATVISKSLKHSYGWPAAISYAIRNHFVHDGGEKGGFDFFAGPVATAAFTVSGQGWSRVESMAKAKGVDPSHCRTNVSWPAQPCDDLREVLRVCEQEVDEALGVLLGTACYTLDAHIGFLLGQDE